MERPRSFAAGSGLEMLLRHAVILAVVCAFFTSSVTSQKFPDHRASTKVLSDISGLIEWLYDKVVDTIATADSDTEVEIWECLIAMKAYVQGISSGSTWALKMVDSTSKIQSGFLVGNFMDLGQYDECVTVEPFANVSFSGMHCLLDLKITVPDNLTIDLDGQPAPISTLLGSNVITLTMGQCYPSTCKAWIIEDVYNILLYGLNKVAPGYTFEASIAQKDCHVQYRGEFTTTEWIVMIFMLLFVFLASLCTTADLFGIRQKIKARKPYPGEQMLLSFSVHHNWKKLISVHQPEGSISCLNGFKAISIAWVVLGHKYRYLMTQPLVNLTSIPDEIKNWTKMLIFSAPLSVDTFFMISGLLNMYGFCSVLSKSRNNSILLFLQGYIHRYLRLTPAYAMMIAITATWLYRMGNGPVWDRIVGIERDQCRTEWWWNILYVNNYVNPETYCMMQSWYLAADMQMFWLSPLVIYPLWRWPWFGYIEVAILAIASIASPFTVSYLEHIKTPTPMSTNTTQQRIEMDELYLPTHTKTSAYIVGILTGYLLYQFKNSKITFRMNKAYSTVLWALTAAFMLYAVFGGYQMDQFNHPYNKGESAFYIGFYRMFWALGLMWMIIACVMGYGGPVDSFLSWKVFVPFGRLTYCIYLTHIAVILYGIASMRQPTFYRDYSQVQTFFGELAITTICATLLSLLLESPIMTLEKLVFGSAKGASRPRRQNMDTEAGPSGVSNPNSINGGDRLNY